MPKKTSLLLATIVCLLLFSAVAPAAPPAPAAAATKVAVLLSATAAPAEKIAAEELVAHLRVLYPQTNFVVGSPSADDTKIRMGTLIDMTDVIDLSGRTDWSNKNDLSIPDSYAVYVLNDREAVIAGSNPRAVLYAVSALLEKLGFGFYLSHSTQPAPRTAPFSFDADVWNMHDAPAPAAATRAIFNWHNFLSGCSTWNLDDWQRWITQAVRMRFNTIMVHAYGHTPIFNFTYNGQTKTLGHLTNTRAGRDNGTQHVLDVRKILGADGLYPSPIFGADASLVPDDQRAAAAIALMQQVFQFAAARGMEITFGTSVDTPGANPQNIINTLPATARFTAGGHQIANPDTPEGHAYYRALIGQLLATYPEITQVAFWFRGNTKGTHSSPLRGIKPEEFPPAWKKEYQEILKNNRPMRSDPDAPSMFAIGKIIRAHRKALDELGHARVTLAVGSWRFDHVPAADVFMPDDVTLLPLDYNNDFSSTPIHHRLRDIGRRRPIVPIVWAHHDDFHHAGRSHVPYPGFGSLLNYSNSDGFAIIHWITRPLDLYFKNTANQVWTTTLNESLDTTAARMAQNTFGADPQTQTQTQAQALAARYLLDWIYDAPAFGEETSNTFLKRGIDPQNANPGTRRRLKLLAAIKPLAQTQSQRDWIDYHKNWELYAFSVLLAQSTLQKSIAAQQAGDMEQARNAINDADPKTAIEHFARAIRHGQPTRGELGLLVSLNLRWLPYFTAQRIALGLEPLRIKFAPTQHDPDGISLGMGSYTFDFDENHNPIAVMGEKELGTKVQNNGGIKITTPVDLALGSLAKTDLPDGPYTLRLDIFPTTAKVQVTTQTPTETGTQTTTQTATSDTEIQVTATEGKLRLTLSPAPNSPPPQITGATIKKQ